jgi:hypothetical protein
MGSRSRRATATSARRNGRGVAPSTQSDRTDRLHGPASYGTRPRPANDGAGGLVERLAFPGGSATARGPDGCHRNTPRGSTGHAGDRRARGFVGSSHRGCVLGPSSSLDRLDSFGAGTGDRIADNTADRSVGDDYSDHGAAHSAARMARERTATHHIDALPRGCGPAGHDHGGRADELRRSSGRLVRPAGGPDELSDPLRLRGDRSPSTGSYNDPSRDGHHGAGNLEPLGVRVLGFTSPRPWARWRARLGPRSHSTSLWSLTPHPASKALHQRRQKALH